MGEEEIMPPGKSLRNTCLPDFMSFKSIFSLSCWALNLSEFI